MTDFSLEYTEPWTGFVSVRVLSWWKMGACASFQAIFFQVCFQEVGYGSRKLDGNSYGLDHQVSQMLYLGYLLDGHPRDLS